MIVNLHQETNNKLYMKNSNYSISKAMTVKSKSEQLMLIFEHDFCAWYL